MDKDIGVLGKLRTRSQNTVHNPVIFLLFHLSNVANSCKFLNLIHSFCIDQDAIYCEIFSIVLSPCIFLGYVSRYFRTYYFSIEMSCFRIMHIKTRINVYCNSVTRTAKLIEMKRLLSERYRFCEFQDFLDLLSTLYETQ